MCSPPSYSQGMACSLPVLNLSTTQNSSIFTQKSGFTKKRYMLTHRSYSRRQPPLLMLLDEFFHRAVKGQTAILLQSWRSKQCPCIILLLRCTILKGKSLTSITSTSPFSPNWSSPVNKSYPELHLTYKKNNFSLSSQITSQTVMPTVQV